MAVDCGWGRLILGQTFGDPADIVAALRAEEPGRRDIAAYVTEPHVMLALAPQELFLDPSHTFRLNLAASHPDERVPVGFTVRPLETAAQIQEANRIYAARGMLPAPEVFLLAHRDCSHLSYLIAVDGQDGSVIGTVGGIDHVEAFGDPEDGSSLWCLATDPQAAYPGIGECLVRAMADNFRMRGRAFMDLSVMHDNACAIALYEKLGFVRVPVFSIKTRNAINEKLFIGPQTEPPLNPYATIIINEARRRGIAVEVLDAETACFRLGFGGRSIVCRESLSELTSAVALSLCDDKAVTRRALEKAGLRVPPQRRAGDPADDEAFLAEHGRVVVKPARGEQGKGITVDVRSAEAMERAIASARAHADTVLLEAFREGHDLRVVVIDYKVVAAAIRRPAEVTGTGKHTIAQLIEAQSRRRAAATGGESRIPLDDETERCVRDCGHGLDDVLAEGERLFVRKTANLHTGGTLHDVTAALHPALANAAVAAARALAIPVVGLDFLVPDPAGPDYVIIEANERPGLANHEPQPTAERFVDLLFPQTAI
ncbi:N-acetylglutaminylglutamine synthetase (plasmid) [Skermanella mucosa]|uniref:N-acetylglutaminylglutamine synthetase n=1 Tax=Skermanella mucosa TaxID=1789672 RepID=UPI001E59A631|nr:N-acetylglutaminylglutamine synthetase [Skermanella mucosa]UEM25398.1 N-acetylglutaminylglutamine synthetase [Skermanella mucosa]